MTWQAEVGILFYILGFNLLENVLEVYVTCRQVIISIKLLKLAINICVYLFHCQCRRGMSVGNIDFWTMYFIVVDRCVQTGGEGSQGAERHHEN